MFEARAAGRKWSRPRFKPRRKYRSFTLLQVGWKLLPGNRIRIGKVYLLDTSNPAIYSAIRNVALSSGIRLAISIFVCVTDHEAPDLNRAMTGKIAGFDFGLKRYLTGHNGHDIESPQCFKRSFNVIKRASRKHSPKRKSSNNRKRARLNLARKHRTIEHQRSDFHWKLAHQLTDEYDEIRLEDLNYRA